MSKLIVLVFRPLAVPVIETVENELKPLQALIGGGFIQELRIGQFSVLLDEDGIEKGLPVNPALTGFIAGRANGPALGDGVLCRSSPDGQHFASVTQSDIDMFGARMQS